MQKIHSSGVLLYVVALNFYGDKAFFGKFMVVRVRLWSNTNPDRGEAPIGQNPVWAGGAAGDSRGQENNDVDSRILTMMKNFILMGVRMMMLKRIKGSSDQDWA
jgi:hypothetical protein